MFLAFLIFAQYFWSSFNFYKSWYKGKQESFTLISAFTLLLQAWICGRSLSGIVGSNTCWGMEAGLLGVLCVLRYRSLLRAGSSPSGVLPSVVCLNVIVNSR
jgi:hypothetical protein